MTAPYTTPYIQLRDENGEPAVGWKIYTYEAGTSTPKTTWKDYNKVATNTNPVVLDDEGSAIIWLDGAYKFIVKDAGDNLINTADDILAYPSVDLDGLTATVDELNATDTSIITVGDADYTVQLSDRGKTIVFDTTLTTVRNIYLPKVIDATDGFLIWIKNNQINVQSYEVYINAASGDLIDNNSNIRLENFTDRACIIGDGGSKWGTKVFEKRGQIQYFVADFNIDPILNEGQLLICDSNAASFNAQLPAISRCGCSFEVSFKKRGGNTVNILPNGSDIIEGGNILTLSQENEAYKLKANSYWQPHPNWQIVSEVTSVAQWVTGDVKPTFTLSQAGWVLMNDGSIGNAGSGATTRANIDTQDVFVLLWNNIPDTYCPVSGGRGASASADFLANKTLTLPKALGRAMACYGTGSGLTTRLLGQYFGEEKHALTSSENGPHTHGYIKAGPPQDALSTDGSHPYYRDFTTQPTESSGDGTPHNTMQPTIFMNFLIKL